MKLGIVASLAALGIMLAASIARSKSAIRVIILLLEATLRSQGVLVGPPICVVISHRGP